MLPLDAPPHRLGKYKLGTRPRTTLGLFHRMLNSLTFTRNKKHFFFTFLIRAESPVPIIPVIQSLPPPSTRKSRATCAQPGTLATVP